MSEPLIPSPLRPSPLPPERPLAMPAMPGAGAGDAAAWKSAQDFEAMALNELLKPMFDTVDLSKTAFGGGTGEEMWQPMLVTEIAKKIAQAGGLGLAGPIYQQILRMQEASDSPRKVEKAPPGARGGAIAPSHSKDRSQ